MDFLNDFEKQYRTNNLFLRIFSNICSDISSWAILKACFAEEDGKAIRYSIYGFIFGIFHPLSKWSTVYVMKDKDDKLD